jgi:MFS family permease
VTRSAAGQRLRGATGRWAADLIPGPGAPRRLAALTFTQSLGTGLFLTSIVVLLVKVAGIGAAEVGWGLSLAGLCGFGASLPAGRLADRFGARRPLALAYAGLAALYAGYGLVAGYRSFVVIACLVAVCDAAVGPIRAVLVYALCQDDQAPRVRAQMRSAYNLGFVLGAAAAAMALTAGSRSAFIVVGLVSAAAHLLCSLVTLSLGTPRLAEPRGVQRQRAGTSRTALRNGPFLLVTAVNGALELHQAVLMIGIPLWIVSHTGVPTGMTSVLLVLCTVCVVLFQVAVGRKAHTAANGARLQRHAGILLGAACCVFALSGLSQPLAAGAVLVVGALLLVFGEMAQTAGAYALSFELPPPGRQGDYQGVFALGRGIRQALGPVVVTSLVLGLGVPGWVLLGGLFVALGAANVPLARLAKEAGH